MAVYFLHERCRWGGIAAQPLRTVLLPGMGNSEGRRRIYPDYAGGQIPKIAIGVLKVGIEEKRVPWLQHVDLAVNG